MRIIFCSLGKTSLHRIHPKIFDVFGVVGGIFDCVLIVAFLPDLALETSFSACAKRKTSLDVLHHLLKRNVRGGSEDQMNVISQEDKLVNLGSALRASFAKNVQEKVEEAL